MHGDDQSAPGRAKAGASPARGGPASPQEGRTLIDPGAAEAALADSARVRSPCADTVAAPDADAATGPTAGARAAHLAVTREASEISATEMDTLIPGRMVRQYQLIRELGEGGMGRVFLARDTVLGRKVAIKFLRGASRGLTDRFLVEARATARCTHENIVVIYEVNEHLGLPFMVLEYLDGQTLRELMPPKGLPVVRVVELMLPVVRALVRAHGFGFVHRDLKPENIFVRRDGTVKVLDFGIAKYYQEDAPASSHVDQLAPANAPPLTRYGALVGTLAYMSPEQWGTGTVDHQTDLWAAGLVLHELVTGVNPLSGLSEQELLSSAASLDQPLPSVTAQLPRIPPALSRIIDRCLAKRKEERFETAAELAEALEKLLPDRAARQRITEVGPYPGLVAFQEEDAARFHGRSRDIRQARHLLRERPLVAVVGPSGVGKSSFVRAGLIPALKSTGEPWETYTLRPGRSPVTALGRFLSGLLEEEAQPPEELAGDEAALGRGISEAPGAVAELLRRRARRLGGGILLFVDQLEELYTVAKEAEEREAFVRCLLALADDPGSPLRVAVSMRADFLHRVAADRALLGEVTRGLMLLQPLDRDGMRAALVEPLGAAEHTFESPALVETMLDALEATPGALPLLQFTASRLWEARDVERRMLTEEAYAALGGVAGALAAHAAETYAGLTAKQQGMARRVLPHLVTSDGTRAVATEAELEALGGEADEVRRVLDRLIESRLLTGQEGQGTEGRTVELVHESLITTWPMLRHWLEESREDAALVEQLRSAARQWDARARPPGLLWRGDAAADARQFKERHRGGLPPVTEAFLRATLAEADRAGRRRRLVLTGTFVVLVLLVVAAAVALVWIRQAEQEARSQARAARRAERKVKAQLAVIRDKERQRKEAEAVARRASDRADQGERQLATTSKKLAMSYEELQRALEKAQQAQAAAEANRKAAVASQERAEAASTLAVGEAAKARAAAAEVKRLAEAEKQARERAEKLLAQEKARVKRLELELLRRKMATDLK